MLRHLSTTYYRIFRVSDLYSGILSAHSWLSDHKMDSLDKCFMLEHSCEPDVFAFFQMCVLWASEKILSSCSGYLNCVEMQLIPIVNRTQLFLRNDHHSYGHEIVPPGGWREELTKQRWINLEQQNAWLLWPSQQARIQFDNHPKISMASRPHEHDIFYSPFRNDRSSRRKKVFAIAFSIAKSIIFSCRCPTSFESIETDVQQLLRVYRFCMQIMDSWTRNTTTEREIQGEYERQRRITVVTDSSGRDIH